VADQSKKSLCSNRPSSTAELLERSHPTIKPPTLNPMAVVSPPIGGARSSDFQRSVRNGTQAEKHRLCQGRDSRGASVENPPNERKGAFFEQWWCRHCQACGSRFDLQNFDMSRFDIFRLKSCEKCRRESPGTREQGAEPRQPNRRLLGCILGPHTVDGGCSRSPPLPGLPPGAAI
jgi:hypothetical protein